LIKINKKEMIKEKLLSFSPDFFFFDVIIINTKGSAICQNYTPFCMAIPKDLTSVFLSVFLFY